MPDIDPSALSRPISTTPILPPKLLLKQSQDAPKVAKSNAGPPPPRIDLEPLYMAVKGAVGEHWATYKDSISKFLLGQLSQAELSARIDFFIITPGGDVEHLHNQLIAGIYGNATREIPDHAVASWVTANDKPTTAGSKPVSGDAAEQRLKTEVMQLPNRDRKRMKDLTQNEFDPADPWVSIFGERKPKAPRLAEPVPASAGGLQKTNWDLEIRKRYAQPLASETGEFPDTSTIESRMLPICYETGLVAGHVSDAAHFMSVATETFIKEVLSSIFSKTRSNGPGTSGSAGTGGGANWVQTHKYRAQLEKEEEDSLRGLLQRDKSGLLPIEAKAAGERGPLGMADVRMALELGDCGIGQFPVVMQQIMHGYREGEVELWDDYSYPDTHPRIVGQDVSEDVEMGGVNGANGVNGHAYENGDDDWGWEGCGQEDKIALDNLLDSCLTLGA